MIETNEDVINSQDSTEEDRRWCVYCHTSPSGKRYVGITSKNPPELRWGKNGRNYLIKNSRGNYSHPAMARALLKYPNWDEWKHEILLVNETEEYAKKAEKCLIKSYKSNSSEYGYNLTIGGDGVCGAEVTQKTREILSTLLKNRWSNPEYRKKYIESKIGWSPTESWIDKRKKYMKEKWKDPEYRAHMSELSSGENNPMYGKSRTDEEKKKISNALKGKYTGENSHNYGRKMSEETKQLLREINTGKHVGELNHMYGVHLYGIKSGNHKPIYCLQLDELFWGAKAAQDKYGFNRTLIGRACRDGIHVHAGKHPITNEYLSWMFAKDAVEQNYITQERLDEYISSLN